ncbi:hypothetical protein FB381_1589 [Nocardioides albertanoniae]|uniref:DUF3558 domain-containing protein n=1 Tax=Nocardioides albertanoniae TaxID=1175486 RepID=A0A543A591_9ACTN|nr:hypothetical protein [Nocardioides albertanoniae]TQL67707.1 hypothetical protein FB381_1589 [Nocardioides albertanoniae]
MQTRAALTATLLVIAATSGCGSEPAPRTTGTPSAFSAESTSIPSGFTAAECPATVNDKHATLKLAVPTGFTPESTDPSDQTPDGRCSWRSPDDLFFSVEVGEKESLGDLNDELKQYEDIGGDDEVKDVTYDAPTDAFGGMEGERLSWWTYSDGSPADCVDVQAGGVHLSWQNPEGTEQRLDDLDVVLESVELVLS